MIYLYNKNLSFYFSKVELVIFHFILHDQILFMKIIFCYVTVFQILT